MSDQKILSVQITDPAVKHSLEIAMALVQDGIPFVAVPCFSTEQAEAAQKLGLLHITAVEQSQSGNQSSDQVH